MAGARRERGLRWKQKIGFVPTDDALVAKEARKLSLASEILLDRLFSYLSKLPDPSAAPGGEGGKQEGDENLSNQGISLPASAVGWLASQILSQTRNNRRSSLDPRGEVVNEEKGNENNTNNGEDIAEFNGDDVGAHDREDGIWMGVSVRHRLSLLKFLLPRLTHIRITRDAWPPKIDHSKERNNGRGQNRNYPRQNSPFLGRDLNFSGSASVNSALTMDSVSPRGSKEALIRFMYQLQNKPNVDFQLFPNVAVVVLDSVPPSWIRNLSAAQDALKVLRVERGCIYHVPSFFFCPNPERVTDMPSTSSPNGEHDLLAAPPTEKSIYKKLSHLRLSNCGIGEMSGLREKPMVFERLPVLESLCLSHNELQTERHALAGLSSLPRLVRLDLSFNYISSMRNAFLRLGQIQVLVLSSNRLESAVGIDRLYGLRELRLDHNRIASLSSISGLSKLPELFSLYIDGNPFTYYDESGANVGSSDSDDYRISVLNLFWAERSKELDFNSGSRDTRALCRDMSRLLPSLDERDATFEELGRIHSMAYRPTSIPTIPSGSREAHVKNSGRRMNPVIRSGKFARRRTSNKVIILDKSAITMKSRQRRKVPTTTRKAQFTVKDIFLYTSKSRGPRLQTPELEQVSAPDAPGDFLTPNSPVGDEPSAQSHTSQLPIYAPSIAPDKAFDVSDISEISLDEAAAEDQSFLASNSEDASKPMPYPIQEVLSTRPSQKGFSAENSGVTEQKSEQRTVDSSLDLLGGSSPKKAQQSSTCKVASTKLSATPNLGIKTNIIDQDWEVLIALAAHGQIPDGNPRSSLDLQKENVFSNENIDLLGPADTSSMVSSQSPTNAKASSPKDDRNFPLEQIWHDDASVPSSLGTILEDQNKFRLAEENSVYDGPESYKGMLVLPNMSIYYRTFVFSVSVPEISSEEFTRMIREDDWQLISIQFPRIQLWPDDRRSVEMASSLDEKTGLDEVVANRERFVRVWNEELVPCGKPAARRLNPNLAARLGFHGDASYLSDGKPDVYSMCRNVTVCLSSDALYIIVREDRVTKRSKKKFPVPIAENAYFRNAPWPHAAARHSLGDLQSITIGFDLQRLTLCFSNPSSRGGEPFTYVLLTSSKMETASLLQDFQNCAKEVESSAVVSLSFKDENIKIDNDDRAFLEAIGSAVSPDIVEAVLHYQIVQQRWKRGERGTVRRACVLTDSKIYLLDEDYMGDGSDTETHRSKSQTIAGRSSYRLVDQANLEQVAEVQAAGADPKAITLVISPTSRLSRVHRWRLVCRTSEGAERLVDDVRKVTDTA